jgi:2-keto-3-deoxy-L-rhamnonate aldolase RhmA
MPPSTVEAQRVVNAEILTVVMIESPEAVANAAEIAAVDGVDVLLIGTSDLTAELGVSGQLGHPKVIDAYAKVGAACAKHGKVLGMGGVYDQENATRYIGMGARFILSGADHSYIMAGAAARTAFLRDVPLASGEAVDVPVKKSRKKG